MTCIILLLFSLSANAQVMKQTPAPVGTGATITPSGVSASGCIQTDGTGSKVKLNCGDAYSATVVKGGVGSDQQDATAASDGTVYNLFRTTAAASSPALNAEVTVLRGQYDWRKGDNQTFTGNGVEGTFHSRAPDESATGRGVYGRIYIDGDSDPTATLRTGIGGEFSARASYSGGPLITAEAGTAFVGVRSWMAPYFTSASTPSINNFHAFWGYNEHATVPVTNGLKLSSAGGGFTNDLNLQNGETIDNAVDGTIRLVASEIVTGTGTIQGNAFSVGGSSFSVSGGSATVAYSMTAGSFVGNATTASALLSAGSSASSGYLCRGVDASGNCLQAFVDTMETSGSTNTVTSGRMFTALAGKQASGSYAASGANGDITSMSSLASISAALTATSSITVTSANGFGVTYGVSVGTMTSTGLVTASSFTATGPASFATTSGNVGIGTASPGSTFDVLGGTFTVASSGIITAPSQPAIRIRLAGDMNTKTATYSNLFAANEDLKFNITHVSTSSGTLTVLAAGMYLASCQVFWAGNATGDRETDIHVNGSRVLSTYVGAAPNASSFSQRVDGFVSLAATNTVDCRVLQSSGGDLSVTAGDQTWLSLIKLW